MKIAAGRRKVVLGIGAALLGAPAAAGETEPVLTLALIELMPWAATRADGGQDGILVELARDLADLSGVRLRIMLLPYARAEMMLRRGEVDLMIALQSDRLDNLACRMAPVSMEEVVMLGRRGLRLRSIADLHGKTVGRLRNAEYDAAFSAATEIVKYDTSSYRQSLEMMRIGRLDAVIFVRTALVFTLRALKIPAESLGVALSLSRTPLSLYASNRSAASPSMAALRVACMTLYARQAVKTLAGRLLAVCHGGGVPLPAAESADMRGALE